MDLLYQRYASPFEFMRLYIEQGRFGEFVREIVTAENKRRNEQAEKEWDDRLWIAYANNSSGQSFEEFKASVLKKPESKQSTGKKDEDMTEEDINNLLGKLFKT